jgi:hypothetical protein
MRKCKINDCNNSSPKLTTCEIYRQINDLCQTDSVTDQKIRDLCVAGIMVGKEVTKKITPEKLEELIDEGAENKHQMTLFFSRIDKEYKHSWEDRVKIKTYLGIVWRKREEK